MWGHVQGFEVFGAVAKLENSINIEIGMSVHLNCPNMNADFSYILAHDIKASLLPSWLPPTCCVLHKVLFFNLEDHSFSTLLFTKTDPNQHKPANNIKNTSITQHALWGCHQAARIRGFRYAMSLSPQCKLRMWQGSTLIAVTANPTRPFSLQPQIPLLNGATLPSKQIDPAS